MTDLGLFVDRPSPIPSTRAPLDIVRDPVPNSGWKPLLLTTHQVVFGMRLFLPKCDERFFLFVLMNDFFFRFI